MSEQLPPSASTATENTTLLNPLAAETEEATLDERYYRRLTRELTNREENASEMICSKSRTYSSDDLDFGDEDYDIDEDEDDYDEKADLHREEADKAEEIAEQFENRRAGVWRRQAGPKARGQKVQAFLEKLRQVAAALTAAEDAERQLRHQQQLIGGRGGHGGGAPGFVPTLPFSSSSPAPAPSFVPIAAPRTSHASRFNPRRVLGICEKYDDELKRLLDPTSKSCNLLMARVPSVTGADEEPLIAAFDHMIDSLYLPFFRARFGSSGDDDLLHIGYGASVPSYFANVAAESIFRRKMLSVLGLRNLIKYGPQIFNDLRNKLFAGSPSAYTDASGLGLMRVVTGNTLDLDTTVLRLTDHRTMEAVNMMNKHQGLPTFHSLDAFANSDCARDIAVNCAKSALQDFIDLFKLSQEAAVARKVLPDRITPNSIPVATNNTDRGRHALWRYTNAGQDSYHANVPTMDDVIGALLKAPFHCIKQYAFMAVQQEQKEGNIVQISQPKLTKFFEECVVDACFNMKWRAIEEYSAAVAHEGTIVDVLQKLQMEHQSVFSAEFFAADDEQSTNEKAKMFELVQNAGGMGKEALSGKIRSITKQDVDKWVSDPSVKI